MSHTSKVGPGGGNVIVETKTQDVSCFLWPIFNQKPKSTFNYNLIESTSASNLITSPVASIKPGNGRNYQESQDISGIK